MSFSIPSTSDMSSNSRGSLPPLQPRNQEKAMPLATSDKQKTAAPTSTMPARQMVPSAPLYPKSDREGLHVLSDHDKVMNPGPTSLYPSTMQKPGYKAHSQPHQPRSGSLMFLTSDDHVLSNHIEDTHFPDESHYFEVRPLFQVVEDILDHAIRAVEGVAVGSQQSHKEIATKPSLNITLNKYYLKSIIERVFCEMSPFTLKHWGVADGHETALSVLKQLSAFSWEVKAVITLAAFALNYGELWLISEAYLMNPLAKSMAVLKQLPQVMEHSGFYRKQFDAINNLTKAMLNMVSRVLEFKELPAEYVNKEDPGYKDCDTLIPIAVFWIIRGAVAATAQISALTGEGSATGELSNWEFNLNRTYEKFNSALRRLNDGIQRQKEEREYLILVEISRTRIELTRICEDPLYAGTAKTAAYLDALSGKNVLLFISDGLNIPHDELSILEQIYTDSKVHSYEMLWIPIIERSVQWTDSMQDQFERLRLTMPWYSVSHPSKVHKVFIRYVREQWHFKGEPILAVLDTNRRVVSVNAIHMMWIWGSNAFPFTKKTEQSLWQGETWRLELLVDGIDQTVLDWVRQGKFIVVYGTSEYDWIRKFTKEVRAYAQAADIQLEMVYVGQTEIDRDLLLKHSGAITTDKLGHCWQETSAVWFFWKRIESMFKSKIMLGQYNDHTDTITKELKKLRCYTKSPSGWALLSKGSEVLYQAPISIIHEALEKGPRQYPGPFIEYLKGKSPDCSEINFTSTSYVPPRLHCPECHRIMERQTTFKCCHKDGPWTELLEDELRTHPSAQLVETAPTTNLMDVPALSALANEPMETKFR